MRIRWRSGLRRGSVALEVVLAMPIALVFMLASSYVLESMVFRLDLATAVRTAAGREAADLGCFGEGAALDPREGMDRSAVITCQRIDDEAGISREKPYFLALRDSYQRHWPDFLRDVDPRKPVPGVIATGQGSAIASGLAYVTQAFGATESQERHRRAHGQVWSHFRDPWQNAMDPVIWSRLRQAGTYRLFPNVFPSQS